MKSKIIITALAVLLSFNIQSIAMVGDSSTNSTVSLRAQIISLIEGIDMNKSPRFEDAIQICFKVNTEGEVELHEVSTKNLLLKAAIKKEFSSADIQVKAPSENQFYWITIQYRVV